MQSPKNYATICNAVVKAVEVGRRLEQGRVRRHLAARQQPARHAALVGLAARVPAGDEERRREGLRRLRPPPVLRLPERDADRRRRRPASAASPPTAVTLGNFEVLTKELQRVYRNMRIWVTEYGYQTNPPDTLFGVTPAKQALYMKQAWTKLVANPKVDMMIWFLLRDEARVGAGWQSGLFFVGRHPQALARGLRAPRRSLTTARSGWTLSVSDASEQAGETSASPTRRGARTCASGSGWGG